MDPVTLMIAFAVTYAAGKIGSGIYNAAKGRKMEKQAVKDREMYINTMSDWVLWGQEQQMKAARKGMEFTGRLQQEAKGYSQIGRATEQEQLSRYFDTLGKTTGRISEKDLMQKKFGLGG